MSSASNISSAISPLPTVFTPPDWCLQNLYSSTFNDTGFFGLGTPCGVLNDSCLPAAGAVSASPASVFDLQPFVYTTVEVPCSSGHYTVASSVFTSIATITFTEAACCPSGWAANETVCQSLLEVRFTATGCDNVATAFTSNASSVAITASAALIVFAWENSEQNQSDSAIPQSLETPTTQTAVPLPTIQNTPHPFMGLPNNPTATLTSTSGAIPNRWRCEGALRLSVLVAVVVSLI